MQSIHSSFYNNSRSTNTQAYPASVPLSVYRDLATELQAAQAKIDALSAQNYHLARENQLLRQEIAKTVQSVLHLQNILDSPTQANYNQIPHPTVPHRPNPTQPPATPKRPRQKLTRPQPSFVYTEMEIPDSMTEPFFVEEQEVISYSPNQRDSERINNWLFFLAVILIICLGFGAGYLIVRPLFENHTAK